MKILILAGGTDQIALIEELRSRGHYVILVDYYTNPPARAYADKHIVASTLDEARVKQLAVTEQVDLIATACTDQALLVVAKVSEELSLPCYLSAKTALNVTNKLYMKEKLVANGIPTAKYVITDRPETVPENFEFPMVVKPVDCNSSKGVKKVDLPEHLRGAIGEAVCCSRSGTAVVEEFKEGVEVSADFYIANGKAVLLCATGSCKMANTEGVFPILQSLYPVVSHKQEERIAEIGQQIATAFGLKNTPLLVQMIVGGSDEYNVLEFSARMGGGSKYKLIEVLSGVNIMQVYVDLILGRLPGEIEPVRRIEHAVMNYVYCKPGIFGSLENFESLHERGILDAFFQYKTPGMQISRAVNSGDRAAGFLVTGRTEAEIRERLAEADRTLKVLDKDRCDIMLHGIYPQL